MKPVFDFENFLTLDRERGTMTFRGNRMLLFNADALGQLRQELIESLGEDNARGVLTRFGYRCGYADVMSVKNMFNFETDAEWMLAGPMIHTIEGSAHVKCDHLEFNRAEGTFLMRGEWHNSNEVEQHLKLYGQATEAVCWTVSGYASGYASGFMGREIVSVETMCGAKGDQHCKWELRPLEAWGREAARYIEDLRPSSVLKSLQKMVTEERERVVQWRGLNEAAVEITTNYDSDKLPRRFIQYAAKMFFAQASCMALVMEDGQFLVYRTEEAEVWSEITNDPGELLTPVLKTGRAIVVQEDSLGVPLYFKGSMIGAMVVVKKPGNRVFNHEDQELLQILGAQAAIAIQNARVYERTDEELQEKVLQLNQLNNVLTAQHAKLKKSSDIHTQLTQLVLECQGLEAIARTLAELINCHVWVEDENFRLISASGGNTELENGFLSIGHLMKVPRYRQEMQALVNDKRLVTLETDSGGRRQIIVPIVAGKEVFGYVSALEKEKRLFELDYIAMEQAGRVFALELLKQKAALAVEMRQREDFIEDLIAGNYESEEAAYHRSAQLGFVFADTYQVFIIDVESREASYPGSSAKRRIYELVKEAVQRESPGSIVISNRYILVLAALNVCEKNNPLAKAIEKELSEQPGETVWWLALGGNCHRFDEFKESYWQATSTLEIMKSLNQENRMMSYERLGVFALLEINKERFARFANRVLRPLIDYDRKHNAQLVSMLELYYRNNGNILKAAREGFLNHSTMKYRLKRIEEIAGIDMDDPDVGLQIQLALKLIN
ncbi:XylR N-terminal domain-containing protein [Desulfosporosinus lacus]|uniref:Sugar diacid utilization regulator n=1 Tax=Desulfosporosinus lacus DSM 15449 TaxID=1121420 RepID=A0A1M5Z0H0_9FIRM|nr:XylR N-terminal domain-containing protein [Desulfosporosinus lacus]SHI17680.1 Sugar diacid utilization regulator [Desulfosporosinus lacus DSM 15449]